MATLKVTGSGAHGTVKLIPGAASGRLGGKKFSFKVPDLVRTARAGLKRAYAFPPG